MKAKGKRKVRRVVLPRASVFEGDTTILVKPVRRVVLGVGQPMYDPKTRKLELLIADFIRPAYVIKLRFGGLGPWNRIRLVAEVLK